jgi:AraC-like DNA-binding protein
MTTPSRTGLLQRHPLELLSPSIRAFEAGASEPLHVHDDEGQLKWPRGFALVCTPRGIFVVPPSWAVWIPAGSAHRGIYLQALREHNVHIHVSHCAGLPEHCCAIHVSPALERALSHALTERGWGLESRARRDRQLLDSLRRELHDLGVAPVPLTFPPSSRIRQVADELLEQDSGQTLSQWAEALGMSTSTFNRVFVRDTGATFGEWRKRVRLLKALPRLAAGHNVAAVARELGYRPSSFIHMFRQTLGTTPGRYYRSVLDASPPPVALAHAES